MMSKLKRALPTFAAVVVVAATCSLGAWQLRRAEEREALAARQEAQAKAAPVVIGRELLRNPDTLSLHPLTARGEWLPEKTVFLDNQIYQGRVGFHVIMPLRISGSDLHVLVDRGWIAGTGNRSQLAQVSTPSGMVDVSGYARQTNWRFKELDGTYKEGRIWENLTVERYAAWSGLQIQPVVLLETSAAADGLVREWPKAGSGAEKNRGYALQWFLMAVTTIALWGYYFLRGRRKHED